MIAATNLIQNANEIGTNVIRSGDKVENGIELERYGIEYKKYIA